MFMMFKAHVSAVDTKEKSSTNCVTLFASTSWHNVQVVETTANDQGLRITIRAENILGEKGVCKRTSCLRGANAS